jgi:trans-2,3-dihydro-3-hydroxyanthranilate isomerase
MGRRYAILDVFTDTPLAGNPLAVVLDGDGLDAAAMQAIAREFNLSETVFVCAPDNPAHTARVRIFTPGKELPFAGHPTVGTAILLAKNRFGEVDEEMDAVEVLEEGIGPVRCGVRLIPGEAGFAEFDAPKLPRSAAQAGEQDALAGALGLTAHEIGFENHTPTAFTAGVPFVFVPVRDLSVIGGAAPISGLWDDVFGGSGHDSAFVYCRQTETAAASFHARMFAPAMGVPEDPATGGAVAAFAGVIQHFDEPTAGRHKLTIEQGIEMGRPSHIGLEIETKNGALTAVRISGHAVVVAEGELLI